MRLGIGSYTYVWSVGVPGYPPPVRPLTAHGLLQKAVDLDVRVVQIADNLPLDRLTGAELDALTHQAADAVIDIEVGTRGIDPEHLRRYLNVAVRLRSPLLRIVLDTEDDRPSKDQVVGNLQVVMPEFEDADVILAIENHDRFPAAALAEIIGRIRSRHVGICLDTANSIGCLENLETVLGRLGPWVVNLHIKDCKVFRPPHHKGFILEGRPAGQGQLNIPWLLGELRSLGRDPNAILELWPPPEATVAESVAKEEAWVRDSIGYLRRFIPD